jgi:hypothetical protein
MNKQVTLTEAEAKLVMQALDIATKAGGLNAASQLLPVAVSIEKQLTEGETPNPEPPNPET